MDGNTGDSLTSRTCGPTIKHVCEFHTASCRDYGAIDSIPSPFSLSCKDSQWIGHDSGILTAFNGVIARIAAGMMPDTQTVEIELVRFW